jgi:hypothetical protein
LKGQQNLRGIPVTAGGYASDVRQDKAVGAVVPVVIEMVGISSIMRVDLQTTRLQKIKKAAGNCKAKAGACTFGGTEPGIFLGGM